jgi:hypothetical protein
VAQRRQSTYRRGPTPTPWSAKKQAEGPNRGNRDGSVSHGCCMGGGGGDCGGGDEAREGNRVVRLSPTEPTHFGDQNGQIGVRRLEDTRRKEAYLQQTPVSRSLLTPTPESSGHRSPGLHPPLTCALCPPLARALRLPLVVARRSARTAPSPSPPARETTSSSFPPTDPPILC